MKPKLKNLVFEGGGAKGLAYLGAWSVLAGDNESRVNYLASVERFAGTSAGSIFALLLGLGYTSEEGRPLMEKDFNEFKDGMLITAPGNILSDFGVHPGDSLLEWLEKEVVAPKMRGNGKATFRDLHEKIGDGKYKDVFMIGANLSTERQAIFSYYTTPDLSMAKAARISSSLPLFFEAVEYDESLFVDGGLINNFPIELFDVNYRTTETLGFRVDSFEEIQEHVTKRAPTSKPVENIVNYGLALINSIQSSQEIKQADNGFRSIYIDIGDVSATDFALDDAKKQWLITQGEMATKKYLSEHYGKFTEKKSSNPQLEASRRFNKYERYNLYDKASALYFAENNATQEKSLSVLQLIFPSVSGKGEEVFIKYHQRCLKQLGMYNPQLFESGGQYFLVIKVSVALITECRHWIEKNKQKGKLLDAPAEYDNGRLVCDKGQDKPAWMLNVPEQVEIPLPREEDEQGILATALDEIIAIPGKVKDFVFDQSSSDDDELNVSIKMSPRG